MQFRWFDGKWLLIAKIFVRHWHWVQYEWKHPENRIRYHLSHFDSQQKLKKKKTDHNFSLLHLQCGRTQNQNLLVIWNTYNSIFSGNQSGCIHIVGTALQFTKQFWFVYRTKPIICISRSWFNLGCHSVQFSRTRFLFLIFSLRKFCYVNSNKITFTWRRIKRKQRIEKKKILRQHTKIRRRTWFCFFSLGSL